MKMTPLGEDLLEQIVTLPKLDRTVLLEQLLLMQQGEPEIALDSLLVAQSKFTTTTSDTSPSGVLH